VRSFLGGSIKPLKGSEYKIQWRVDGSKFGLKYELSHGRDSPNLQGYKLARVLNIIEMGYTIGLDSKQIQAHIRGYSGYNIKRLKEFFNVLTQPKQLHTED